MRFINLEPIAEGLFSYSGGGRVLLWIATVLLILLFLLLWLNSFIPLLVLCAIPLIICLFMSILGFENIVNGPVAEVILGIWYGFILVAGWIIVDSDEGATLLDKITDVGLEILD